MSTVDTIRAWNNEEYSSTLSDMTELTDAQMSIIGGGTKKRGRDIVVITQPIITGFDPHYPGGGPIVPINTVIT